MSSLAKVSLRELCEVVAHVPSVVPRTVMVTGPRPRFAFTRSVHSACVSSRSQPPDVTDGWLVSIVSVEHFVMTRVSVMLFEKSTS